MPFNVLAQLRSTLAMVLAKATSPALNNDESAIYVDASQDLKYRKDVGGSESEDYIARRSALTSFNTDTIDEVTGAAGVIIDGVLVKDGEVDGVDVSAHVTDTTTHGTTGDIVGTSDTQAISNKTITMPAAAGLRILYTNGSGVISEVAAPTAGYYLRLNAGGTAYEFAAAGTGDVSGPGSSTDNAIARFDSTTGKIIQNSVVTIADTSGNMAGVGTLGCGAITSTGAIDSGGILYVRHNATGDGTRAKIENSDTFVDYYARSDTSTAKGIRFWGNNAATSHLLTLTNGETVFNENGNDTDFRIESDTIANAFFLDGANGNVGIGQTPPGAEKLNIYQSSTTLGDNVLRLQKNIAANTDGNYYITCRGSAGDDGYIQVVGTDLAIAQPSDRRLKTNITNADYGLSEINALRPITYDWIDKTGNKGNKGFIAQEVKKVLPDCVALRSTEDIEDMHVLSTKGMIPVLVRAIQELDAKFEVFKAGCTCGACND